MCGGPGGVEHFLFECPLFKTARGQLRDDFELAMIQRRTARDVAETRAQLGLAKDPDAKRGITNWGNSRILQACPESICRYISEVTPVLRARSWLRGFDQEGITS
tara:strand:- start:774 stop:1088 length:315 start_codon:yes stop_codon:yes gene_type:complete